MTRSRTARLILGAVVAAGLAAPLAAPASAEPRHVCVAYDNDRSAICVQVPLPPRD